MQVFPLFAVPFAVARREVAGDLDARLAALCLAREGEGAKHANPRPLTTRNREVFESDFGLFRDPDPALQELKRWCWGHLLALVGELNGYDRAYLGRLLVHGDAWFHVTRRGGFFGLHNHAMASWSGVYCVDPGRHDPDRPESGALTFVNPATASAMYLDAGVASLKPPYGHGLRSLRMQAGELALFPAWLLHDVKPYEGEGARISIAFNCWFGVAV